ncbi:M48 family metallopeptidase [Spirosoma spitsbergense]|uniref:M48 family metallopeptidase n=1 Tax=Spirosoma spitsbergense TaxID=431554 RepID=UPI000376E632|nr:M48 family metallopeptidase [Spirosoma spitsbergense]
MNYRLIILATMVSLPLLTNAQSSGTSGLLQALMEGVGSATLSDAQVVKLSKEAVQQMDAKNPVAAPGDPYAQRLSRIVSRHHTVSGLPLNYKVYKVPEVNAFATADGSVRVFKGLMDIMSDNELLAVMGHEIGHVVNHDTRNAMKSALRRTAVRDALASGSGTLSKISQSQVAGFADYMLGASFSRKQETAADDYSYSFLKKNHYNVLALATSFEKLAKLSGGGGGKVASLLSDHPDSASRAQRVRARARQDGLAR